MNKVCLIGTGLFRNSNFVHALFPQSPWASLWWLFWIFCQVIHIFHFFRVGFWRFILHFCCAIFQFLHVPYNLVCWCLCIWKHSIYLNIYRMVLHRENSFTNLPGSSFSKPFNSFLWVGLLWTSAYQFFFFFFFFFLQVCNLLLPLVSACFSVGPVKQQ